MAIFTIGDPHLSLAANKAMDVFPGWQNYVARLEENWKRLVGDADTVVIPGDISWGMDLSEALPDLQFLDRLPGKKILLKGNHDYWWVTMKKLEEAKASYSLNSLTFLFNNAVTVENIAVCGTRGWGAEEKADGGKVIRREAGRLRLSIEAAVATGLTPVVFLHYPPFYNDGDLVCEEIYSVLLEYGIRRCYFGHLHQERSGKYRSFTRDGIVFSLVSADFLDFCPKQIEESITKL